MSGQAAVAEFCAQMGLPPSGLPVVLSFERSGRLHFEEHDGVLTALLSRSVPLHQAGVAAAALRGVHPDRGLPFTVRATFRGEDLLVLLAQLPAGQVDLPTLDSLVRLLTRLADEAVAAAR